MVLDICNCAVPGNHGFNFGPTFVNGRLALSVFSCSAIISLDEWLYFARHLTGAIADEMRLAALGLITQYIPVWEKAEPIRHVRSHRRYLQGVETFRLLFSHVLVRRMPLQR
ncbi:MAG: hypothetical protein LKI80_14625 [Sporolactobacillus sp.]|jgi:2',3'-cyclic-nucleotide 2'-phosphodiesterase (5'-nucleotidase family)|nr:hypothetical protein [Sporolactobacillus sp.]